MANAPNYRREETAGLALYAGTLRDEAEINDRLTRAREHFILISPSTTCVLRPGCSVSFSLVKIDPQRESYSMQKDDDSNPGGERGLYGTAIFKLANAAGVAWNGARSYRVDDGSDPLYVHWHCEGARPALDGTFEPLDDDCRIDLREGSDQCRKLWEEAKSDDKAYRRLRDTRAKVLERAVTGAKLRALRKAFGLGRFTLLELQNKPFLVTRGVFDGYDDDPEMFRENKRAIRAMMLGGVRAAFGSDAAAKLEAHAKRLVRPLPPPPVGTVPADAEVEDDFSPEWSEAPSQAAAPSQAKAPPAPAAPTPPPRAPAPPPRAAAPPPRTTAPSAARTGQTERAAPPPPAQPPLGTPTGRSGFTMPGKVRGIALEDASDKDLNYWAARIDGELRRGEARFPDKDGPLLAALLAEIDRRVGEPPY